MEGRVILTAAGLTAVSRVEKMRREKPATSKSRMLFSGRRSDVVSSSSVRGGRFRRQGFFGCSSSAAARTIVSRSSAACCRRAGVARRRSAGLGCSTFGVTALGALAAVSFRRARRSRPRREMRSLRSLRSAPVFALLTLFAAASRRLSRRRSAPRRLRHQHPHRVARRCSSKRARLSLSTRK